MTWRMLALPLSKFNLQKKKDIIYYSPSMSSTLFFKCLQDSRENAGVTQNFFSKLTILLPQLTVSSHTHTYPNHKLDLPCLSILFHFWYLLISKYFRFYFPSTSQKCFYSSFTLIVTQLYIFLGSWAMMPS